MPALSSSFRPSPDGSTLRDPLARGWWHVLIQRTAVGEPWAAVEADVAPRWHAALQALEQALATPWTGLSIAEAIDDTARRSRWDVLATHVEGWRSTVLEPLLASAALPVGSPWRQMAEELLPMTRADGLDFLGRSLLRQAPVGMAPRQEWPDQAALDDLQRTLLTTYGLQSLRQNRTMGSVKDQRQRLEALDQALGMACTSLGIAPATWGRVAPHLVLSQPLSPDDRFTGAFYETETSAVHLLRLTFSPHVLRHEWVHALDHWTLQRHAHPAIARDMAASDWLVRTTAQTRQDLDLPVGLQRSLAIVGRLQEELRGEQPPMLEHRALRRFMEHVAARLWSVAAHRQDRRDQQAERSLRAVEGRTTTGPALDDADAYWTTPHERLAHLVEHHGRWSRAQRWSLLRESPGKLAALDLHGSMRLVQTWLESEGLVAPAPDLDLVDRNDRTATNRPRGRRPGGRTG